MNYFTIPGIKKPNLNDLILRDICFKNNTNMNEVRSDNRKNKNVRSRMLYMMMQRLIGNSLTEASELIGRDRTTCIYSMTLLQNLYDTKDEIKDSIDELVDFYGIQDKFNERFYRLHKEDKKEE